MVLCRQRKVPRHVLCLTFLCPDLDVCESSRLSDQHGASAMAIVVRAKSGGRFRGRLSMGRARSQRVEPEYSSAYDCHVPVLVVQRCLFLSSSRAWLCRHYLNFSKMSDIAISVEQLSKSFKID